MGISADPVDRQRQFDDVNSLGFCLLSDADRSIARQFGVVRVGPFPPRRVTFVIGTDRTVLEVISSELNMYAHADRALAVLRRLDPRELQGL